METIDENITNMGADMVEMPLDILNDIIEYIEKAEALIDHEFPSVRVLKALMRVGTTPELHDRLIGIRDGATITKKQ